MLELTEPPGPGLDPDAISYLGAGISLGNDIALEVGVARAKRDTRRYSKRQRTWFKHQLPGWPWMDMAAAERAIRPALKGVPA